MTRRFTDSAFSLVELLATIAILAAITGMAMFFIANYVTYAKTQSDQQTLYVLNDALNRYKTEGGGVSGLNTSTPIGSLLANMQQVITWAGRGHIVLSNAKTFPARSISATQSGSQYHFTRFDTYKAADYSASNPYPYGLGVGQLVNNGSSGYCIGAVSTSGYIAMKDSFNNVVEHSATSISDDATTLAPANSAYATFWSCAGASDPTPSGVVTKVLIPSGITSANLNGLTGLQQLTLGNQLASITIAGCSNLQQIYPAGSGPLTTLDCSQLTHLSYVDVGANNNLATLNLTGCTQLTFVSVWFTAINSSASNLNAFYPTLPAVASATLKTMNYYGYGNAPSGSNKSLLPAGWTTDAP